MGPSAGGDWAGLERSESSLPRPESLCSRGRSARTSRRFTPSSQSAIPPPATSLSGPLFSATTSAACFPVLADFSAALTAPASELPTTWEVPSLVKPSPFPLPVLSPFPCATRTKGASTTGMEHPCAAHSDASFSAGKRQTASLVGGPCAPAYGPSLCSGTVDMRWVHISRPRKRSAARCSMARLTRCTWALSAGPIPTLSRMRGSAFACMSSSMSSCRRSMEGIKRDCVAPCRGVPPAISRALTSAPRDMSTFAVSTCPLFTAPETNSPLRSGSAPSLGDARSTA